MSTPGDYVTVRSAAAVTGVSARTLRYWITHGKLAATATPGGQLVRVADVEHLAAMTGRKRGKPEDAVTSAATAHGRPTAATADIATDAGAAQLAILRDTLLVPLIAQNERQQTIIAEQAAELGQLRERVEQRDATINRLEEVPEDAPALAATSREPPQAVKPGWLDVIFSPQTASATTAGLVVSRLPALATVAIALVLRATHVVGDSWPEVLAIAVALALAIATIVAGVAGYRSARIQHQNISLPMLRVEPRLYPPTVTQTPAGTGVSTRDGHVRATDASGASMATAGQHEAQRPARHAWWRVWQREKDRP